ncbi:MAG: hydroxymethylbilane synthase, partial [bacterium]
MSRENSQKGFRFGSRRSLLAKAQTQWVIERLLQTQPHLNLEVVEIVTEGDRVLEQPLSTMAGKGVFVKEIEDKLLAGDVDFAVHSMKDLPTESVPGLITGAIPERVDPRDVLISRLHANLEDMPEGANIGTGSFRR